MKKKEKMSDDSQRKWQGGGPHLPNVLCKELDMLDHKCNSSSNLGPGGEENVRDLLSLKRRLGKNRRFDEVETYKYELPENFKDEEVPSDEGEGNIVGQICIRE